MLLKFWVGVWIMVPVQYFRNLPKFLRCCFHFWSVEMIRFLLILMSNIILRCRCGYWLHIDLIKKNISFCFEGKLTEQRTRLSLFLVFYFLPVNLSCFVSLYAITVMLCCVASTFGNLTLFTYANFRKTTRILSFLCKFYLLICSETSLTTLNCFHFIYLHHWCIFCKESMFLSFCVMFCVNVSEVRVKCHPSPILYFLCY